MPIGDAEIVQPTGNLQHLIGNARFCQAQHVLDNATPLHPGEGVFHHNAHPGQHRIEGLLTPAQLPPARLFLGW